jgi:hypothetical protein
MNPLNHPVYDLLPQRTQRKLLSPISEDKLTWDCFFGLKKAAALDSNLAGLLGLGKELLVAPRLFLWGFEIYEALASPWPILNDILSSVEDYRDGKQEGQKTEPDAIILSESSLVIIECKRGSRLGDCSRFKNRQCPEIHREGRKRPYCQYWARGLDRLVTFSKPTPTTTAPECNRFYQLMRNHMIGARLAAALRVDLHLLVVKARRSPHFNETVNEVAAFNSMLKAAPKFGLASWEDLRYARSRDLLAEYADELP